MLDMNASRGQSFFVPRPSIQLSPMLDDTYYSFCYVELSDDDYDSDNQLCAYIECRTHRQSNLWSVQDVENFEKGLDFCFVNKPKPHMFLNIIQRFVGSKKAEDINAFMKNYFNIQNHNYTEWTKDEICALVYALQRHPNDYVSMKKYIPTRTLFDLHRYVNFLMEKKRKTVIHKCDLEFCVHFRVEDLGTVITIDDINDLVVALLQVTDDDISVARS